MLGFEPVEGAPNVGVDDEGLNKSLLPADCEPNANGVAGILAADDTAPNIGLVVPNVGVATADVDDTNDGVDAVGAPNICVGKDAADVVAPKAGTDEEDDAPNSFAGGRSDDSGALNIRVAVLADGAIVPKIGIELTDPRPSVAVEVLGDVVKPSNVGCFVASLFSVFVTDEFVPNENKGFFSSGPFVVAAD